MYDDDDDDALVKLLWIRGRVVVSVLPAGVDRPVLLPHFILVL
jgi:hypothetical protein